MQGSRGELLTLPLKHIQNVELSLEKDGSGYLSFGKSNPVWPWLFGTFLFTGEQIAGLELVPDAEKVYQLLLKQLDSPVDPEVREELRNEDNKN